MPKSPEQFDFSKLENPKIADLKVLIEKNLKMREMDEDTYKESVSEMGAKIDELNEEELAFVVDNIIFANKKTVLLIEDMKENLENALKAYERFSKLDIVPVTTFSEAEQQIKEKKIDYAVSDVNFPLKIGEEPVSAFDEIKKELEKKDIPVIKITAHGGREDMEAVLIQTPDLDIIEKAEHHKEEKKKGDFQKSLGSLLAKLASLEMRLRRRVVTDKPNKKDEKSYIETVKLLSLLELFYNKKKEVQKNGEI